MITEQEFNSFIVEYEKIKQLAFSFAKEYAEVSDWVNTPDAVKYLDEVTDIDDQHITLEGEERWRYGGYDRHIFTIPTRYLYDEDYRRELKEQHEKALKERNS